MLSEKNLKKEKNELRMVRGFVDGALSMLSDFFFKETRTKNNMCFVGRGPIDVI